MLKDEKKCCKEVPLEQKAVDYKCQGVCKSNLNDGPLEQKHIDLLGNLTYF